MKPRIYYSPLFRLWCCRDANVTGVLSETAQQAYASWEALTLAASHAGRCGGDAREMLHLDGLMTAFPTFPQQVYA